MEQGEIMKNLLVRFVHNESGATAIEYALIAAGIFMAIIAVVGDIGTDVQKPFEDTSNGLK